MKKSSLKSLGLVLIICAMSIIFMVQEREVKADDFSAAKTIQVNTGVSGNTLQGNREQSNYYKFTVTNAGYVIVNFKNPLQKNSEGYWNVWLYDSDYEELAYTEVCGNKTSTDLTAIGIDAGTYYIKINSTWWGEPASADTYTVTANFTKSEYWEKEFNDDFVTSTPIKVNTSYYGTTRKGYRDERDYYAVNISSNGVLTVNFQNPSQKDSEGYWSVYLYDKEYKELAYAEIKGNIKNTSLPQIGVSKGTYYIKIDSTWYSEAASTDKYTVKAKFTKSNYWEEEFNDNFVSATKMNLNTLYYGTTRKGYRDEADYYKFNTNTKGNWVIGISTPNLKNSDNYWSAYLYDSSYNEIAKVDISGNIKYHIIKATLKKGTYYLKIDSTWYSKAASTERYGVKVYKYGILKPISTKISGKIKSKKKGFTVKWTKSKKSVGGYQVQYSLKKDFKKAKKKNVSKSKASLSVGKLKKKRRYYVRIRTYVTYNINGVYTKVYSSWSSVKKVRTK